MSSICLSTIERMNHDPNPLDEYRLIQCSETFSDFFTHSPCFFSMQYGSKFKILSCDVSHKLFSNETENLTYRFLRHILVCMRFHRPKDVVKREGTHAFSTVRHTVQTNLEAKWENLQVNVVNLILTWDPYFGILLACWLVYNVESALSMNGLSENIWHRCLEFRVLSRV